MHAKELAVAPPFRRVLDAEIVVAPDLDTGRARHLLRARCRGRTRWSRPALLKAELAFRALDVDCAIANEGSYGPIERVPLGAERHRDHGLHRPQARHQAHRDARHAPHQLAPACASRRAIPTVAAGGQGDGLSALRRVRGLQQRSRAIRSRACRPSTTSWSAMNQRGQPLRGRPRRAVSPTCAPIAIRRACACCARCPGSSPSGSNGFARNASAPGFGSIGIAARPALRGLRPAHPLGRFRDRRLLGLRPRRSAAAQGWAQDGAQALLQGLSVPPQRSWGGVGLIGRPEGRKTMTP